MDSFGPLLKAVILKMCRTVPISEMNSLRDHCCGSDIAGFVEGQGKSSSGMRRVFPFLGVWRDFTDLAGEA